MYTLNRALTHYTGRCFIYISSFIVGSALYELVSRIMHPVPQSTGAYALAIMTLAIFTLIGALFASQKHLSSRVSAGATLFVLGAIAVVMVQANMPYPYALIAVLGVVVLGGHPALHKKLSTSKQIILAILPGIVASLTLSAVFVYATYLYAMYL